MHSGLITRVAGPQSAAEQEGGSEEMMEVVAVEWGGVGWGGKDTNSAAVHSVTGLMRGYGRSCAPEGAIKITDGRERSITITPHSYIVLDFGNLYCKDTTTQK